MVCEFARLFQICTEQGQKSSKTNLTNIEYNFIYNTYGHIYLVDISLTTGKIKFESICRTVNSLITANIDKYKLKIAVFKLSQVRTSDSLPRTEGRRLGSQDQWDDEKIWELS